MSMTKEEAIKYGENKLTLLGALGYNDYYTPGEYCGYYDEFSFVTAALSALRPITREQVEKMRGEWTTDGVCSRCGFDAMYYKGVPVQVRTNYCPTCGSPMTDEAVETIMKRMEEMRND